jgi:hypothetical protein
MQLNANEKKIKGESIPKARWEWEGDSVVDKCHLGFYSRDRDLWAAEAGAASVMNCLGHVYSVWHWRGYHLIETIHLLPSLFLTTCSWELKELDTDLTAQSMSWVRTTYCHDSCREVVFSRMQEELAHLEII